MITIVYNSNAGHSMEYAKLLARELDFPVYSLTEAKKYINKKDKIIFITWIRANDPHKLKNVLKKYTLCALCTVGMTQNKISQDDIINKYNISVPVYYLPGGFDIERLKGLYKIMMTSMKDNMSKKLQNKESLNPDELLIAQTIVEGRNFVSREYLEDIIMKFKNEK